MPVLETPAGRYYRFESAPLSPQLVAVSTTREVGPADPSPHPDPRFLEAIGLDPGSLAWCGQEHGARILASAHPGGQGKADALITECREELVEAPYIQSAAAIRSRPERFDILNREMRRLLHYFYTACMNGDGT